MRGELTTIPVREGEAEVVRVTILLAHRWRMRPNLISLANCLLTVGVL